MAKNWTLAEAIAVLKDGTDKEARADIAKRYPLLATATIDEIIAALPEKVTARIVETQLADGVADTDTEEAEEKKPTRGRKKAAGSEDEKPVEKTATKPAKGKKPTDDDDFDDFEDDDDFDDFEDDDEEEEKPVKKSKATKSKPAPKTKKATKKPADDEDDFDDDDLDDF